MREKKAVRSAAERRRLHFKRMQIVIVLFVLLTTALYLIQRSVTYELKGRRLELLPRQALSELRAEADERAATCLLVWQDDAQGRAVRTQMEDVLEQMGVHYDVAQAEPDGNYDFERYETVVLALTQMGSMGEHILDLMKWTRAGGGLMLSSMPSQDGYLDMVAQDIGVSSVGNSYQQINAVQAKRPFMPGAQGAFELPNHYQSALQVQLSQGSKLYLVSDDQYPIPLIWRWEEGSGTVAVMNLGYTGKAFRGFYAAAYSLLGEAFAWPVINGSAFFLDDFPSPLPYGGETNLRRDYGMGYRDFLTRVWWIDIQNLGKEYGARYTGALLETYSDETKMPLPPNRDLSRFQYFGRSLLDGSGEIALHGYNHMPLVMRDFDYRGGYDACVYWDSTHDMQSSLNELIRFSQDLYPNSKVMTYVPPSNILSPQARSMLSQQFPALRVVASSFAEGGVCCDQEFEVAPDGIVELPRIVNGYTLSDTQRLAALSELTLQYVSTHSQHSNEVMDDNSGKSKSWSELRGQLEEYMIWLRYAAPGIRSLTAGELAAAVQRYDALGVTQSINDGVLTLELEGFYDEAWLLVRLNAHSPGEVDGGQLQEVLDGLYLLKAEREHVTIRLD